MHTKPTLIYKIVTAEAFAPQRHLSHFAGMPIDLRDGFIHFSDADQLAETLKLHFAGQSGLLLLAVRAADLGDGLIWEPSRGGMLLPHLYGPFPTSSIVWEAPLSVAADGTCTLPEAVR